MNINKLLLYLVMAVAMVLPVASGCINKSPVDQAVICKAVSRSREPLMVADNLTPDVKTIYCSVKLAAVQPESNVKAEWYVVKSAEAGLTDTLIGSSTVAAETPYVAFVFTRAETLLPRGEYQVKLYYDNKFVQSVPFQVQGEAAPPAATLSESVLCSSIDRLTEKPIVSANIFPSNVSSIYCSVKISGADFNDQVKVRWVYEGGELGGDVEQKIAESSVKVEGREYLNFSISPKEGKPFPKGRYSVRFYVGDIEQLKLPFSVVEDGMLPALYVNETYVYAFKDKEQKEINRTSRFPIDTQEIFFRANIYNAPPGTPVDIRWTIVHSKEAAVDDYQFAEDKMVIDGTLPIAARLSISKDKLVRGDYSVRLLLNGEEKVVIPFIVQ